MRIPRKQHTHSLVNVNRVGLKNCAKCQFRAGMDEKKTRKREGRLGGGAKEKKNGRGRRKNGCMESYS